MSESTKILDLVDTLDAIVWEGDARTFAFTFVSRRAEVILGYAASRWISEPTFWLDHVHPDDREEALRCCQSATRAGEDHSFEYRMIAADGRHVWLRDLVRVFTDADGQPDRLRGVMIDITREKEMQKALNEAEASRQRSEATFRAIIEGGNDLVSILEADGTIRYASPSHQRLLGWPPSELEGRNAFEMVHPDDLAVLAEKFAAGISQPGAVAMEQFRYRHRDGGWRLLEGNAASLLNDPIINGAVINSRDVSQRHAAEAELRRRLVFEKLVVEISSRIANAEPGVLDEAIGDALGILGRHLGASLVFIALNLHGDAVSVVHEWAADGVTPIGPQMQHVPASAFAWLMNTLRNDGCAAIDELSDLPPEAAAELGWLSDHGMAAGRAALMVARGQPLGFIDCVLDRPGENPVEEDLRLLRIVGEICANAIARQREEAAKSVLLELERRLSGTLDLHQVFDCAQAIVRAHLGCARVSIYYGDDENGGFRRIDAASSPLPPDLSKASSIRPGHPVFDTLLRGEVAVAADPAAQSWFTQATLASFAVGPFIIAPITVGGHLRGMFCAARPPAARPFHSGEVEMFDGIARQISLAVQSAEIYREKQAEATVASALVRVGNELITALDPEVLYERTTRLAGELLDGDSAQTYLWHREDKSFQPVAVYGETHERWEALRVLRVPGKLLGTIAERIEGGAVFQVDREERLALLGELLAGPPDFRSILYIPLRHAGETVGCLVVGRRVRSEPFTADQLRIAQGLGQLASLALVNARVVGELERLSRLKSDFVATMSHELRTPLNVIMGYNDLLLDNAFGPLGEQQVEIAERVRRSAGELLELINATLDVSRLDSGRLPVERRRVAGRDLLSEIEAETRQLGKAGVRIDWEAAADLPALFTDSVKVKVVVKNLLGNALKFTDAGAVRIAARPLGGGLEIEVSDTGIGIEPEAQAIIFEAFRQADASATRRHGGVGLGLYIVRRLLDLLGGSISLESELGRGSTFRVWLPGDLPRPQVTADDAA